MKNAFIHFSTCFLVLFISEKVYSMNQIVPNEPVSSSTVSNVPMTPKNNSEIPLTSQPRPHIQRIGLSTLEILTHEELVAELKSKHININDALSYLAIDQMSETFGYNQISAKQFLATYFKEKIFGFFNFTYNAISDVNIFIFSIMLLKKAMNSKSFKKTLPRLEDIERIMGTLLLVSSVLAQKFYKDIPIRNSWWAKTYGIPLDVLNTSEITFLGWLNYSLEIPEEDIITAQQFLIFQK